jgi:8-oxo-dGTP pyrophosphatase MutT (NUDIX family)
MREAQKSRQAATVILLRPAEPSGFEVFLTHRPDEMAFLGGTYCFPGGAVRKDDCAAAMLRLCYGLSPADARRRIGAHLSASEALGFWIAGVRELFEETGVLLAVDHSGRPWRPAQERGHNLFDKHAALLQETLSFRSLLENEKLVCDASRLVYFSHWQTPEQSSIRFDTRFFLAVLPENQTALPASPEVAHSFWVTPDRALELFAKNELPLIFPTFASLRTLADFDSLEAVMREYSFSFVQPSPKGTHRTMTLRP